MEVGPRCADFDHGDLHVIQQLRHSPQHYGGFYLSPPKSGSAGTVDLDSVVAEELATHLDEVGPIEFELPDVTSGERQTRSATVLFTSSREKLLTDTYWSEVWADWREAAGWPKEGTFHSLRHFFATTLMSASSAPTRAGTAVRVREIR